MSRNHSQDPVKVFVPPAGRSETVPVEVLLDQVLVQVGELSLQEHHEGTHRLTAAQHKTHKQAKQHKTNVKKGERGSESS